MTPSELEDLVKEFKNLHCNDDPVVNYCLCQDSLDEVIKIAVAAEGVNGKLHDHQRRVGREKLRTYYNKLLRYAKAIETCNSFDDLYKKLEEGYIKGIGLLTMYDIAIRIAAFMEKNCSKTTIFPDKVYLHAGSEKGAEKLLGRKVKRQEPKSVFPPALQSLTCDEIETFLCNMKAKLSPYKEGQP